MTTTTTNMIYLGVKPLVDTEEWNWTAEHPDYLLGTYDRTGMQMVSMTSHENTTPGLVYDDDGGNNDYFSYQIDGISYAPKLDLTQTYTATITEQDGTVHSNVPVILLQMTNGQVFLMEYDVDAIYSLDNMNIQTISVDTFTGSDYTGIYNDTNILNTTACFVAGTRLATPAGPRPVEELQPGDQLVTLDHGVRGIGWIGHTPASRLKPSDAPVVIEPGALGPGCPAGWLRLSPNHRLMLCNRVAERMFGSAEVLVPAKRLLALPGVGVATDAPAPGYWHIAFSCHEIVLAEAAPAESLYPGPMALAGLTADQLAALRRLFAGRIGTRAGRLARLAPKGALQARMIDRLLRNGRAAVAPGRWSAADLGIGALPCENAAEPARLVQ